jgi:hypothetical protein
MQVRSIKGLVHIMSYSGHRPEYLALFVAELDLDPIVGRISWQSLKSFVKAERMLFATIDDDLAGYFVVALLRAMRRRETVGLWLRPHSCFQLGWKSRVKRGAFRVLRRFSDVTTLSIIPTELVPAQASVVSGWVHDPQLWDLQGARDEFDTLMQSELLEIAKGRRILAFLAAMIEARPELLERFCVVVAGTVTDPCRFEAERLQGMGVKLLPYRISNAEMAAIYESADLVWACYDPSYDQASGIFGHAVQRGRIAVIREGAMLEAYASMIGHPVLALPYHAADAADRLLKAPIEPVRPAIGIPELRLQSMKAIREAL